MTDPRDPFEGFDEREAEARRQQERERAKKPTLSETGTKVTEIANAAS
jgi:hypothetical protein